MARFPRDAPKQRVIKALELLGFRLVREHEHIAMARNNADDTQTPLTMPNHRRNKRRNTMSNIVIDSVIGPDGTLHLDVPIGIENANQPVRVVIEAARKPMTRAEWGEFVRSMAGSITDPTFERPPQLPLEVRESLP